MCCGRDADHLDTWLRVFRLVNRGGWLRRGKRVKGWGGWMRAGLLETLQVVLGTGEGALQTALGLHETLQEGELVLGFFRVCLEGFVLGDLQADELPVRDGHLLDVAVFGGGSGAPLRFQVVAKLVKILAVFAGQHDGTGAMAVPDRFQDENRAFRIDLFDLFDLFDVFECFHIVFEPSKPIGGWLR